MVASAWMYRPDGGLLARLTVGSISRTMNSVREVTSAREEKGSRQ